MFIHGFEIRSISRNNGYCSLKKLVPAFNCTYQDNRECNLIVITPVEWAGIAQSAQRLATGWTVRRQNSGASEITTRVQTGPGAHPASRAMGTGSHFRG